MKDRATADADERQPYTVAEAARRIGVNINLFYVACRNGQIPGAFRIGGKWLIARPAFDEFLRTGRVIAVAVLVAVLLTIASWVGGVAANDNRPVNTPIARATRWTASPKPGRRKPCRLPKSVKRRSGAGGAA